LFENIAAIDIGSSTVKMITVKTGFRDFQIKSFHSEYIDQSIENKNDAVASALKKILSDEPLDGFSVLLSVPMEQVIIRNITFPFYDIKKISEAIPFEAEENLPFGINDVLYDFQMLKSENENEGNVLLGATLKSNVENIVNLVETCQIHPARLELESNALLNCYKYFNTIDDEIVIQLHVGNTKTVLNIISNNSLLYTRSISSGISEIFKSISGILKCSYLDSIRIYNELNIDITSFENNIQRGYYKTLNIPKNKFKNIYQATVDFAEGLVEQADITTRAFFDQNEKLVFNRIFISGGGATLSGMGTLISSHFDSPVVSLPFLDEYREEHFQEQFPVAFGMMLSYLNSREHSINFLQGEFSSGLEGNSSKTYYLSLAFIAVTVFIFIVNLIVTSVMTSRSNDHYNKLISEKFKRYFHQKSATEDPVSEALKILKKEKKEISSLSALVPSDSSIIELMSIITGNFPDDPSFILKNLVINNRVIRVDGTIGTSKKIDIFKDNLEKSNMFDSVSLNIKYSKKDEVRFSMTIKQKIETKKVKK